MYGLKRHSMKKMPMVNSKYRGWSEVNHFSGQVSPHNRDLTKAFGFFFCHLMVISDDLLMTVSIMYSDLIEIESTLFRPLGEPPFYICSTCCSDPTLMLLSQNSSLKLNIKIKRLYSYQYHNLYMCTHTLNLHIWTDTFTYRNLM